MLRVNVGLSRKLSKDYNSTGYSINLDGEVTAPVSDPDAVVEQVKELFDLAEEALNVQVERSQSIDAIASHDAQPQEQRPPAGDGNGRQGPMSAAAGNWTDVAAGSEPAVWLLGGPGGPVTGEPGDRDGETLTEIFGCGMHG